MVRSPSRYAETVRRRRALRRISIWVRAGDAAMSVTVRRTTDNLLSDTCCPTPCGQFVQRLAEIWKLLLVHNLGTKSLQVTPLLGRPLHGHPQVIHRSSTATRLGIPRSSPTLFTALFMISLTGSPPRPYGLGRRSPRDNGASVRKGKADERITRPGGFAISTLWITSIANFCGGDPQVQAGAGVSCHASAGHGRRGAPKSGCVLSR